MYVNFREGENELNLSNAALNHQIPIEQKILTKLKKDIQNNKSVTTLLNTTVSNWASRTNI